MCPTDKAKSYQEAMAQQSAKAAAKELANLMHNKIDIDIDSITLRLFIQAHWSRIKTLAHTIHEDRE